MTEVMCDERCVEFLWKYNVMTALRVLLPVHLPPVILLGSAAVLSLCAVDRSLAGIVPR